MHQLCGLYSSPKKHTGICQGPKRSSESTVNKVLALFQKTFNAVLKGGKRKAPKAERETPNTAARLLKRQLIAKCAGLPFHLATLCSFFLSWRKDCKVLK